MNSLDFWEEIEKELESLQPIYDGVDCYRSARNSYLERCFSDYPNLVFKNFTLSFVIGTTAKNAPLVYAILDTLSNNVCSIDVNKVFISINNENCFIDYIQKLYDLLVVAGSWRSFVITFREVIMNRTEFGYLVSYIEDRNNLESRYYRRSIDDIRRKYLAGKKRRVKKEIKNEVVRISNADPIKCHAAY